MTLKVTTESGSTYEIDMASLKMRRSPTTEETKLRRDSAWIQMLIRPEINVGQPLRLALEPLDEDYEVTMRVTTDVVSIEDVS